MLFSYPRSHETSKCLNLYNLLIIHHIAHSSYFLKSFHDVSRNFTVYMLLYAALSLQCDYRLVMCVIGNCEQKCNSLRVQVVYQKERYIAKRPTSFGLFCTT